MTFMQNRAKFSPPLDFAAWNGFSTSHTLDFGSSRAIFSLSKETHLRKSFPKSMVHFFQLCLSSSTLQRTEPNHLSGVFKSAPMLLQQLKEMQSSPVNHWLHLCTNSPTKFRALKP